MLKLGAAMVAVLARTTGPSWTGAPWTRAAHSAAVLKGAALPFAPPF
ncbi:hypothetical protein [Hyalangium rubrum]|uniref:Uncharacterized protein n=1 Tax=Hyalangium rubrum TaxID=3103134 RepID=A0ABU5HAW5_9BACT|nr:hypothetical protein [Hyalangium sp. s54d21]MDY7230614.1 hypothetical protein [Hyalangium sp. s54d21]